MGITRNMAWIAQRIQPENRGGNERGDMGGRTLKYQLTISGAPNTIIKYQEKHAYAPGAVHHVIDRGINHQEIFSNEKLTFNA